MDIRLKRCALALASASLLALQGCGGGGGSAATSSAPTSTFSGVAATGAPLAGASVVVTDASGATVGTTTTASDGSYALSFDPTAYTAPFVITASGSIGEAQESLVSVQSTTASATVNVTPITHAIAALMSTTGNPLDLVANSATDKANITTANVTSIEAGFRAALAANMTAAGLDPTNSNLISGTFNAQLDTLLDNIRVEVMPSGEIAMASNAGSATDDLGNTATEPTAAKTVVLPKGTVPSAALAADLPAPATTPVGIEVLETARLALTACFAQPAASRYGGGTYHPDCANLAVVDYKHDGRDLTAEFGWLITDSGNDNMVFQKPEILRQLSMTQDRERLVVRLSAKRSDGQIRAVTTVAENNRSAASGWQLVGNQRDYETFVNGVAVNRLSANTPANNRYETGLNLYVGAHASIASVLVTGPGLPPAGITLKPRSGCDFLTIAKPDGTTPYCASLYRFRAQLASGAAFDASALPISYMYATSLTDSDIQAIKPLDLYKFVITKTDTTTVTYWNRLRSRPLTVAEMTQVRYIDFDASTKAMMTAGTLYSGGAAPTLTWTVPDYAPRPFLAYFFHLAGSDRVRVPLANTSATVYCSGNSECDGQNYVTTLTSSLTPTSQYGFQTVSRNRYDTQIFSQLWR